MQRALQFLQQAGKTQGSDDKKRKGLEKTVEWLKQESQKNFPKPSPMTTKRKEIPKAQEKPKPPNSGTDYEKVLNWLENPSDEFEDADYYKKLHNMLPGKGSQANEIRAKEITKAMKWVKKQGLLGSNKETESKESDNILEKDSADVSDSDILEQAVEEDKRAAFMQKSPSVMAIEKSEEKSSKSKKTRKTKESMKSKKQASLRNLMSPDSKRKSSSRNETTMKDMLASRKPRKKTGKKAEKEAEKDYENALKWLTARDDTAKEAKYFKKLDSMVPKNPGETVEERAANLVKALHWVRRTTEKKQAEARRAASPTRSIEGKSSSRKSTKKIKTRRGKFLEKEKVRKERLRKEDRNLQRKLTKRRLTTP